MWNETWPGDDAQKFVGIDPGWGGSVAAVSGSGLFVGAVGFKGLTEADVVGAVLDACRDATFVIVERVASMPGQGVSSTFKFGWSFGLVRAAVIASGAPWAEVTPAKWQTALGCKSGGDKGVLVMAAQKLWPGQRYTKTGKGAIADGLLLAEYGRRFRQEPEDRP